MKMMGSKRTVLMAMVLVLAVALVFSNVAFSQGTAKAAKKVKVGYLFDFTGPMAGLGLGPEQKFAFDMFMQDHLAWGGFSIGGEKYMIEPVIYDDKGVAEGAREGTNRLVFRDNVKFIAWEMSSSGILAMQPIIQQNKVLTVAAGASKEILNPKMTYYFRAYAPQEQIGVLMYDWLAQNMPEVKKIAVLTYDDAAGRAVVSVVRERAAKYGIDVVDVVL